MVYRRQFVLILLTAWLFVSNTQSQERATVGRQGPRKRDELHAASGSPHPVALQGGVYVGDSHGVLGAEMYQNARRLSKRDSPKDVSGDGPRLSTEKRVEEGANGVGVEQTLVPSYCPVRPFERYVALHRDIMAGTAPPRYLVFRPYLYCGMGNRLRGFQGVLQLAIVTDRALLVDWYGGVIDRSRLSHKFEDNFLEAHGVPHNDFPSDLLDYENSPGTQIWCQMPKAVRLSTPCDESKMTPDFLSTATWDSVYASDVKVVVLQAHNDNPTAYLRENKDENVVDALSKFDAEIDEDTFGRCAFRFLFKAKRDFQERYCEERQSVLKGKFATVSIHIRTGDNRDYHPEWYKTLSQDVENFVSCAAGLEQGLALVVANSSGEVYGERCAREREKLFVDFTMGGQCSTVSCMQCAAISPESQTVPGRWVKLQTSVQVIARTIFKFLEDPLGGGGAPDTIWPSGADSNDVIDIMKKGNYTMEFGGKVAYIEGDVFHRTHSGSKAGIAADNEGPLLDLILLSESLLLVESYHSTFSQSIAQVGGLPKPMRLVLKTPFARLFGTRMDGSTLPWVGFDNFEEGCRDVVTSPNLRDSLELAVRASREPFIRCGQDDSHD